MSAVGNPLPVLQTKLYRPRITQDYVRRSRLSDRLKQIECHPLTLVSATAVSRPTWINYFKKVTT